MIYLENSQGVSVVSGNVGYIDNATGTFKLTTTAALEQPIVVVARNEDDTAQTIEDGASGWFQFVGHCPNVITTGTTAIGDWLKTSTTAGSADPDTDAVPPAGAFGVALSACTGVGQVQALLIPGLPYQDNPHYDLTADPHGSSPTVSGTIRAGALSAAGISLAPPTGGVMVTDGITAPTQVSGGAIIFVDTADGDLKVIFGDGHTAVLAADS
jgi:hypothetical protein